MMYNVLYLRLANRQKIIASMVGTSITNKIVIGQAKIQKARKGIVEYFQDESNPTSNRYLANLSPNSITKEMGVVNYDFRI